MNKKQIEVVAGVIFDGELLLACQRPAGKSLAGFWEFPGGKVEPGETLERALHRELAEELDLQVTILDEMYRLEIDSGDKKLVLHFLRAIKKSSSEAHSCEQQQFKWLKRSELNSVQWLETDREFVNYLAGR